MKALIKVRKQGDWVPCELKPTDFKQRFFVSISYSNWLTSSTKRNIYDSNVMCCV